MTNKRENADKGLARPAVQALTERQTQTNCRVLASDIYASNDTHATGLNNNDLIIGPSGSGKTRGYVMPNIDVIEDSFIVADTKRNLYSHFAGDLRKRGYETALIDFVDIDNSTIGYNPLDFISTYKNGSAKDQDIMRIGNILKPVQNVNEPFWDEASQQYIECAIGYVMDFLPQNEHTMSSVEKIFSLIGSDEFQSLMREVEETAPMSLTARIYRQMKISLCADKMHSSILGIAYSRLNLLCMSQTDRLYCRNDRIDFADLGKRKYALFMNVSDSDRSMDTLVNLLYTQALQTLINSADMNPSSRLNIPVRLFLDDFAANFTIPDFDRLISIIRSREISASIIIQSLSQLKSMYGEFAAQTILNNCDTQLYLGGQDVDTADYFSSRLNKTLSTVLEMPLDQACLFIRGQKPRMVDKYDPARSGDTHVNDTHCRAEERRHENAAYQPE
jgi:type IV secretion system protein VirD4